MNVKDLQDKVSNVFKENFGYTPLNERIEDITREFFELKKWTDFKNLKEEAGDLLCSLIKLHSENDWDLEENIEKTLEKINTRGLQYKTLGRKTKVAIYGGAFDPITNGHIQVCQFLLNTSKEFDEVWIMPAYKHMYGKDMVSPEHRLEMCKLAARVDQRIKVFDYEIQHQLKGETYYFVKKLKEEEDLNKYFHFSLVIGLDNAMTFDRWVNYDLLERLIRFVVIPRKGYQTNDIKSWFLKDPHVYLNGETNIMEVSSSEIRNHIKNGEFSELDGLIDKEVKLYIVKNNLYV